MKVTYSGERCYHPGTGLDLVPGEMEVTEEQAQQLAPLLGHVVAYHADGGDVHHTDPACREGNNIEPENRREGTGGLPPCASCGKTEAAPRRKRKE